MFEKIEHIFEKGLDCSITVVEIIGALIILYYVIKALVFLLQKKHRKLAVMLSRWHPTVLRRMLATASTFLLLAQ